MKTIIFIILTVLSINLLASTPSITGVYVKPQNRKDNLDVIKFNKLFNRKIEESMAVLQVNKFEATLLVCGQNILDHKLSDELLNTSSDFINIISKLLPAVKEIDYSIEIDHIKSIQNELVLKEYTEAVFVFLAREIQTLPEDSEIKNLINSELSNFISELNFAILTEEMEKFNLYVDSLKF